MIINRGGSNDKQGSFRRDLGKSLLKTFSLGLSVIWVGSLTDLLNLVSDLVFSEVIKNWGFGVVVQLGVE